MARPVCNQHSPPSNERPETCHHCYAAKSYDEGRSDLASQLLALPSMTVIDLVALREFAWMLRAYDLLSSTAARALLDIHKVLTSVPTDSTSDKGQRCLKAELDSAHEKLATLADSVDEYRRAHGTEFESLLQAHSTMVDLEEQMRRLVEELSAALERTGQ